MTESTTRIKITGKLTYEDELSIAQAAKIIQYLNSDGGDAPDLGEPPDGDPKIKKSKAKQVDNPREAIEVSGAKTNPEKIVALGKYVLQDGGETFKVEDVKAQFRRARETTPGNFTRDLNAAIGANWIAEDEDAPGEYYPTSKVDGIFDGGFSFSKGANGSRTRGTKSNAGSKSTKAKTKPDSLADIDIFDATMDGFPPYNKMKIEKDRLLWVVLYMREKHGRTGLTNKEIEFISDRIGVGIPNGNIAGVFASAKRSGYANKSTQENKIRITDDGAAYVKTAGAKAEA